MLTEEETRRRIIEAHAIRRWYQKMPYGGIEWPFNTHFEDGKTNNRSYGEGRWHYYIRPILEKNDDDWKNSSLCDIGCSAGLFLLRSWEYFNFNRLLGVEAANGGYAQLQITKDYYDQMPLETYKLALGKLTQTIADSDAKQLDIETFPIVDITLMSCVHYHMDVDYLMRYLQMLSSKSLYLLLLTHETAGGPTNASSRFFKTMANSCWELVDELNTQREWLMFNPPCKDLTILLYRSRTLRRLLVDECFEKQMNWHGKRFGKHNRGWSDYNTQFYTNVFPPFIDAVLEGKIDENNHKNCLVYDWQERGRHGSTSWPPKIASERTLSYINMVKTMKDHGQEQPIGLQEHVKMVDPWNGLHRVAVAKHLGFKYIYGVDVIPENAKIEGIRREDVRAKRKVR